MRTRSIAGSLPHLACALTAAVAASCSRPFGVAGVTADGFGGPGRIERAELLLAVIAPRAGDQAAKLVLGHVVPEL